MTNDEIKLGGLTFRVEANEFSAGDVDISANATETYGRLEEFYKELQAIAKAEHERKLQTYGFIRRTLYLANFHIGNWWFRVCNRDLFKP